MKILIVIPTYNEAHNIKRVLDTTLNSVDGDLLVVDDNSFDDTRDTVRDYFDTGRVFMLERPRKLGLGSAYTSGFKWGLERGYDLFFEMDADLSHDQGPFPISSRGYMRVMTW